MAVMAVMLVEPTLLYNAVKTIKLYSHTVTTMPSSELKLSQRTQLEIKHSVSNNDTQIN